MKLTRLAWTIAILAAPAVVLAAEEGEREFYPSVSAIGHHPVHPMLIVFPLGLLLTSVLFELIYAVNRDQCWHRAAGWMIGFGVLGGIVAAIPGFIDYFLALPAHSEPRDPAADHWHLMVAAMAAFVINLGIRWRADTSKGGAFAAVFILALLGAALLVIGGYFGGHLVFLDRVGVSPTG